MTPSAETARPLSHQTSHRILSWLQLPVDPFDILATLSQALGATWVVQRETDCEGEVSILAMAIDDDDNALPTFILYERDGLTRVAMVRDDAWQTLPSFVSAQAAVAAVVRQVACLPNSSQPQRSNIPNSLG